MRGERMPWRGARELIGGHWGGIEVADWLKGSTITTRSLYSFSLFKWLNYCSERAAKLDSGSAQKHSELGLILLDKIYINKLTTLGVNIFNAYWETFA